MRVAERCPKCRSDDTEIIRTSFDYEDMVVETCLCNKCNKTFDTEYDIVPVKKKRGKKK